jgi:CheY-like chemotaxis protein
MNKSTAHSSLTDILGFYGVKQEAFSFSLHQFTLSHLIQQLFSYFQPQANTGGIILIDQIDSDINSNLYGNFGKLHLALFHLLHYSFSSVERGFVKLDCKLASENEGLQVIEFTIMDTGVGIAKERIDFILEQAIYKKNLDYYDIQHQDLALILGRELIALSGGKLKIASIPEMGTKYSFKLAFKTSEINNVLTINKSSDLSGIKILLVEDLEINQIIARSVLEAWGVEVHIANNGIEAIDLIQNYQTNLFDLILMDIQMPEMDGLETTHIIRERLNLNIPIIALTANTNPGDREEYLAAGMNEYVAKPFNSEELFNKIMGFLRHKISLLDAISPQINTNKSNTTEYKSHQWFDLAKLRELFRGDELMVNKMQISFLEKAPPVLASINEGLSKKNWPQIAQNAHKLKSSIDLLSIQTIRNEIRQIEALATSELCDENSLTELIEKVNEVCEKVFDEIRNNTFNGEF